MAKFEAKGTAVFQLPVELPNGNVSMGFCVCVCDNGADLDDDIYASEIARCLNQDDDIKDLAAWLLKQKTLHINKERRELLEGIVNG